MDNTKHQEVIRIKLVILIEPMHALSKPLLLGKKMWKWKNLIIFVCILKRHLIWTRRWKKSKFHRESFYCIL